MSETDGVGAGGRIFEIQRFCIDDGPGIRTTVFLKGCPLSCIWCHNPEGVGTESVLFFQPDKCIGCGYCVRVCEHDAHAITPEGHGLDRAQCVACGTCAVECYAGALELVGREVTVAEVLDEVVRDEAFYRTSGGGMTLSGGEPLLQIDFAEALLMGARDRGLHCCVETSGLVAESRLARVMPHVDLFLYDLKETDPERHRKYTGQSNTRVLANLRFLHDQGASILLRLPVIPGLNDRSDHFSAVAALYHSLPGITGVQIMPYHPLGTGKLERLGVCPDGWYETSTPEPATVAGWVEAVRSLGVDVVNGEGPKEAEPVEESAAPGSGA